MKELALSLMLCAAAFAPLAPTAIAEGSAEPPVVSTLLSDGSTNTWTQADLVAALQLLNRKYHRETDAATGSLAGRAAWHGKCLSSVADPVAMTVTSTYEDGTVFVDHAPVETAADRVSKANERLKTTMRNGVPARLADARAARMAEKATTNEVSVAVEAGM